MAPRFFENANYDFVSERKRRQTKMLSLAVLAFAIVPGLIWQVTGGSWYNMGVDFTGGTVVQMTFKQPVALGELRGIVNAGSPNATITEFGSDGNAFLVRAPVGDSISNQLTSSLTQRYGAESFEIGRAEAVSPKVGAELRSKAILAISLSFLATLIYLAFRLQLSYGVAAISATVHDIIFAVGLIAALHLEVSLTTVAALLTIIGYSMNDKIVIFDRIRENSKTHKKVELAPMVNRSINETLPRTVMTGGSVLAVLFVLFLLGGLAIRDFALIMFLGIVVGTYSSIWVGPAVLLWFEEKWPRKPETGARVRTPSSRLDRPTSPVRAKTTS